MRMKKARDPASKLFRVRLRPNRACSVKQVSLNVGRQLIPSQDDCCAQASKYMLFVLGERRCGFRRLCHLGLHALVHFPVHRVARKADSSACAF